MVGAISGAGIAAGSGEVEVGATSLEIVTCIRGGIGGGGAVLTNSESAANSAACAATTNTSAGASSRKKPDRVGPGGSAEAIVPGYGAFAEPEVTSEICVTPDAFSSPITAITRP